MLVLPVDPFVVNFPTGGDSQIPDGTFDGTASLLFTTQRDMGVLLIWIASLLAASAIGWRASTKGSFLSDSVG